MHTSNQPLDEDLEDSCDNQGVQQTDGGVVEIPERADPDLADEEDSEGDEEGHQSRRPNRDDLVAKGVGKLRVDNLAVTEGDWIAVSHCRCMYCGQGDVPGKLRLGAGSAK